MADNISPLKWLDKEELQKLQESFSDITGMSAITIDMEGRPITRKNNGSSFCDALVSGCFPANAFCRECQKYGAYESQKIGRGSFYYCHMGLVEISVPIIIDGQIVACLVGGMVFERAPKEEVIKTNALKYGLDPDYLWDAAKRIPIVPVTQIHKAANFMYKIAGIIADKANSSISTYLAGREIERAGQMKDDFLANMSHEIRTPMNAVIGMADIALHEEMPATVREYIEQIQSSGKNLLHIINDILDYSKISSGKMSIIEDPYEPAIIVRDVNTIIMNRLRDKKDSVELYVEFDASMPSKLIGDGPRIQQILINLANNAVKFTNSGRITITFSYKMLSDDSLMLKVSVSDTGIGIKPEDMGKLFQSFSQVDSKRNRNVEGTGLGLSIVQQLVELMGGEITVESEYEKGSTFAFSIPQKIDDTTPIVKIRNTEKYACLGFFDNLAHANNFQTIADNLRISSTVVDSVVAQHNPRIFDKWIDDHSDKECFVFFEQSIAESGILDEFNFTNAKYEHIHYILLLNPFDEDKKWKNLKYITILRRPFTVLSLSSLLPRDSLEAVGTSTLENATGKEIKFIAPTAKVLVVDDTPMNLKVAERFLKQMQLQVDCASSGQTALDMMLKTTYDIVFMDHMMPGIDGIDTTRIIRRFHPKWNSIPVIALTANAMENAKKMFLDEGMNDFIAKPIDAKQLREKVRTWLPPAKIEILED